MGSVWGWTAEEVCECPSVSCWKCQKNTGKPWQLEKKTGQWGGGAAVQACSGSCFVKHNFLVHDWIMFFQVEEKRIWDVFLRIYLMTTYLLNFSQKSSHKYLILIVISASLFPRAWFIDKIPCTSLQTKQQRLENMKETELLGFIVTYYFQLLLFYFKDINHRD